MGSDNPVENGAPDEEQPIALEKTQLANNATVSVISKDADMRPPRFIEPRPRGSSCCPNR